jgi:hypothetical protein
MKQKRDDPMLVFPKQRPKTIRGLHKWHRKLLEDCVYFEFKKRALEAAIRHINREIQKYVRWLRNDEPERPALLALDRLHRLKSEWKHELDAVRHVIRVLHDTNEMMIAGLLRAVGADEFVRTSLEGEGARTGNLLHEPGWLTEVEFMEDSAKEGRVAFLTFGTAFDSRGVDAVTFARPNRRIQWRHAWPQAKRKRSRAG